jgi:ankyrin repeat protein
MVRIGEAFPPDRQAGLAVGRVLLEHGASIFCTRQYGPPLLSLVDQAGDGDLADFLLVRQLPGLPRDSAGNSVAHVAACWGRTNVLKILAERKSNLEVTNAAGLTPLQVVARLPKQSSRYYGGFRGPNLGFDGTALRQPTARLLITLGVSCDIFSATGLGWTNAAAQLLRDQPDLVGSQDTAGQTPLHSAAEFGEIEMATLLLESGASTAAVDHQGQTPLDLAAAKGNTEAAILLVKSGAAVLRLPGIVTPQHRAAEQGNLELLEVLANAGADLNAEDSQHQTPLEFAARQNQAGTVKWLVARHAHLRKGGSNRTIPLHWAAAHANTNLITFLLQQGSDINAHNDQGKTPLHLVHEKDSFDLMEFLLARGADVNARDTNGNTMLHVRATAANDRFPAPPGPVRDLVDKALANPSVKKRVPSALLPKPRTRSMMGFLLVHGAEVNATNACGETPLHRTAFKTFGGTNAVREAGMWLAPLLRRGANLNARDIQGRTPLHLAILAKNRPVVEVLIAGGAKANVEDNAGARPLHLLCGVWDDSDAAATEAELLLQARADVNARNKSGATPLIVALINQREFDEYRNRAGLIAFLLSRGANANALDAENRTPLLLASSQQISCEFLWGPQWVLPGDVEPTAAFYGGWESPAAESVPSLLLTNGAIANLSDDEGNTPLHYAARSARVKLATILLAHGAVRNARNKAGKTPLEVAYESTGGFQLIPLLQASNVSGELALAAWRGDIPVVKAFLEYDLQSTERPWMFGATALHWACAAGHLDVVKLLLDHGAAVDPPRHVRDEQARLVEFNALCNTLTVESNRLWTARTSGGPTGPPEAPGGSDTATTNKLNAVLPEGARACLTLTPLQLALAGSHTNIALLLIQRGAKIDLASAATLGLLDVLEQTIRAEPTRANERSRRASWFYECDGQGYEWNSARDEQTGTLLHFAVRAGRQETVEFLLEAGADPNIADDEGRTPLQLAVEQGRADLAEPLGRSGASRAIPH